MPALGVLLAALRIPARTLARGGRRLWGRVLLRLGVLRTRVLLRGNLGRATLPALDELLLPLLLRLGELLATLHVPAPTLARGGRRLRGRVLLASLRRGVLLARVLLRVALRLTRVRLRPGVLRAPELLLRLARVGLRLGRLSRLPLLLVSRLPLAAGDVPGRVVSMTHDEVQSVSGRA